MTEQLPDLWRTGLSTLLTAETEQAALEAAVTTIAELLDGPAVGVLKGRAEHLTSVVAREDDRYAAPLFVEALHTADPRLADSRQLHQELFEGRQAICVALHDETMVLGAICALEGERGLGANSPYIAILELAFVRTVQRIRRLDETRLLYEISLRLGRTLDLPQLLQEVLALTTATFAATSSRIFLFDERAGDLVMTVGSTAARAAAPQRIPLDGSIAGWVVRNGAPLIRNSQEDGGVAPIEQETGRRQVKLICVPLKQSDRTLGALMLVNRLEGPDFQEEDLRLLVTIAGTIGVTIANARLYERAIHDALTGAYNRGAFDNTLQEYWTRWSDTGEAFGLVLMDLDNFKQINDHFGHSTGDVVLQTATRLLWGVVREGDKIFRYGGEEFAVLLRGVADTQVVAVIAERLRAALDRELTISNLVRVRISASLGVALHPLHGVSSPRALLDVADDAAYQAKRAGKNRVVIARSVV